MDPSYRKLLSALSTDIPCDVDFWDRKDTVFHKLYMIPVNSFEIASAGSLNVLGWIFSGSTEWKTSNLSGMVSPKHFFIW